MFRYDWKQFDPKLGLYHMGGVLIVFYLAEQVDGSWLVAGISALARRGSPSLLGQAP